MSASNGKHRILYVEDDPKLRTLLPLVLQQHGFEVRTASDGYAGVDLARSWLPDLILMDLMLPVMDDFEATIALRADPHTAHLPIVAYSATLSIKIQRKCRAAGMDGFIPKLVKSSELVEIIKTHLHDGKD